MGEMNQLPCENTFRQSLEYVFAMFSTPNYFDNSVRNRKWKGDGRRPSRKSNATTDIKSGTGRVIGIGESPDRHRLLEHRK